MLGMYAGSAQQLLTSEALKKIRRIGGTARFREMDRLERYYHGNQHAGKEDWFTEAPVRERAPVVLSGLPRSIVEQAVRFALGEGKFPSVQFQSSTTPRKIGGVNVGLSVEEATRLEALWSDVARQIDVKLLFREAMRRGLSMRTACGVYSLKNGRVRIDLLNAKNCELTRGEDDQPVSLECRYIFPRDIRQLDGTEKQVWFWYRRVIDAQADTVFQEAEVRDGTEPAWAPDPLRSSVHGCGFAPVFWCPNLPRMDVGDADGVALIDGAEDEIDAVDYALSVRHSGALFWGSPQGWETGVVQGRGPAANGRTARTTDFFETDNIGKHKFVSADGGSVRKRSTSSTWKFEEADVKLGLLESNGGAATMVTEHINHLKACILESVQVVLVDASAIAGHSDMSAKMLELLYAPLLALVDDLRECWGNHLLGLVSSLMRFLLVQNTQGKVIYLATLADCLSTLDRFNLVHKIAEPDDVTAGVENVWLPPPAELAWGEHFTPTQADVKAAVVVATLARGENTSGDGVPGKAGASQQPLITRKRAVEYVARYFNITDVQAEIDELDKEAADKKAQADAAAQQELEAAHAHIASLSQNVGAGRPGAAPPKGPAKPPINSGRPTRG